MILAYYYYYKLKIDLYRKGLDYRSILWKVQRIYHKLTNKYKD